MAGEPESDVVAVTLRVVRLLEELGVPYVIGGSLASSVHGTMRSTGDVDFVVDLRPEHVAPFVRALEGDFYVSESRVTQSVETGRSFNVIALEQMFKVDLSERRRDLRPPMAGRSRCSPRAGWNSRRSVSSAHGGRSGS